MVIDTNRRKIPKKNNKQTKWQAYDIPMKAQKKSIWYQLVKREKKK